MAVFRPVTPNLAPFFGAQQRALEKRADIAATETGTLGDIKAATSPIVDFIAQERQFSREKALEAFKSQLDVMKADLMDANKIKRTGFSLQSDEDVNEASKELGLPPEVLMPLKGKGVRSVQEATNFVNAATLAAANRARLEKRKDGKGRVVKVIDDDGNVVNEIALGEGDQTVRTKTSGRGNRNQLAEEERKQARNTVNEFIDALGDEDEDRAARLRPSAEAAARQLGGAIREVDGQVAFIPRLQEQQRKMEENLAIIEQITEIQRQRPLTPDEIETARDVAREVGGDLVPINVGGREIFQFVEGNRLKAVNALMKREQETGQEGLVTPSNIEEIARQLSGNE